MLTDEELTRLLEEAAGSFDVPEPAVQAPPVREHRDRRRWLQGAAAAAVLVLGVAVVQAGNGSGAFHDTSATFDKAPGAVTGRSADNGGTTGAGGVLAPTTPDALVTGGSTSSSSGQDGDTARVVKTGELSLEVDDGKVTATVVRLQALLAGVRGYVADSSTDEAGEHPTATLTVRVPVASFDVLVQKVRAMGVKVVSASSSGKDVTATYADTQAQIQSLKAARSRYLVILSRARTIGETLTVQQRVDEVQQQIDRLEGQRRVLADQSDYGTLTISVAERGSSQQVLVANERTGWSKAWHDATHGFTSGVQGLVGASGRALLVLLCAAALALVGRSAWRLARRRMV